MMMNNKKMAMAIIKGAGGQKDPASNQDFVDREGQGKPKVEIEIELGPKDGMEAAMSKFMAAMSSKDAKKASEAMQEFMSCCEEEEESDYSMEPSKEI